MLDHITLLVKDYEKCKVFYLAALAPLEYGLVVDFGKGGGLGLAGKLDFWIREDGAVDKPRHVAFTALDKKSVDAFYAAALQAGGKDNGAPGIRERKYGAVNYAAFVFDPEGNNIEVVCHEV